MRLMHRLGLPALLALALLCVYWEPVWRDPVLGRDDRELVEPMRAVRSVSDYLEAVRANVILDRQPVRDVSFWLDTRLGEALGVGTLHLTNLLVWWGCVLVAGAILRVLRPGAWSTPLLLAVFALHPVFANSVAWISARKHLLALLFLLLATREVVRLTAGLQRPRVAPAVRIALWYALAMASHPIGLAWPLWALLWVGLQSPREARRAHLTVLLGTLPLMALTAGVNLAYYSGPYVLRYGNPKLAGGGPGVALLAFGRYLFQLGVPLRLATQYNPGSPYNLVGLLLAPALALVAFKRAPWRDALSWLGFIVFPLVLVTARMTNIFVSDTYLLLPGFGAVALATMCLPERPPRLASGPGGWALAAVLLLLLGVGAGLQARTWLSDRALWEHAYATEPTPQSLAKHAQYLLSDGEAAQALEHALELKAWDPNQRHLPMLLARSIFLLPGVSPEDKLRLLKEHAPRSPWTQLHRALLLAQQGNAEQAFTQLDALVGWDGVERESVLAEAARACVNARRPDCDAWLTRRRASVRPPLNAARLEALLAQLGVRLGGSATPAP